MAASRIQAMPYAAKWGNIPSSSIGMSGIIPIHTTRKTIAGELFYAVLKNRINIGH